MAYPPFNGFGNSMLQETILSHHRVAGGGQTVPLPSHPYKIDGWWVDVEKSVQAVYAAAVSAFSWVVYIWWRRSSSPESILLVLVWGDDKAIPSQMGSSEEARKGGCRKAGVWHDGGWAHCRDRRTWAYKKDINARSWEDDKAIPSPVGPGLMRIGSNHIHGGVVVFVER